MVFPFTTSFLLQRYCRLRKVSDRECSSELSKFWSKSSSYLGKLPVALVSINHKFLQALGYFHPSFVGVMYAYLLIEMLSVDSSKRSSLLSNCLWLQDFCRKRLIFRKFLSWYLKISCFEAVSSHYLVAVFIVAGIFKMVSKSELSVLVKYAHEIFSKVLYLQRSCV